MLSSLSLITIVLPLIRLFIVAVLLNAVVCEVVIGLRMPLSRYKGAMFFSLLEVVRPR